VKRGWVEQPPLTLHLPAGRKAKKQTTGRPWRVSMLRYTTASK